ncbi:carboxylesterase/lipase family protein [Sphingomonas sp. MA1305]|uniref:carboxylesterase/lipase family protein n=1 Tax=Sphingomonas sp. MA1305 TaxID=2479204 RepID=UPI0018DF3737|nr:carboxylesterase family protein [Sphingomonas sp. MA1305]
MARIAAGALALALATAASAQQRPTVSVEGGALQGVVEAADPQVRIFRGIPYAVAPVGALRWQAPRPAAHWSGVRAADTFGPRCMQQPLFSDMMFRSPAPSEDCLYLNVWTPAGAGKARGLPVLFYLHGGGFAAGDGSEKRYDGAAMARRGIVVVTINYRLGVFGFLAHPALTAESREHSSGNYGMLDQAAALAWVRRNIAAFGGDPKRITIGGESAGSLAVSALMTSPLSRDAIAGAIGESGAVMQTLTPAPLAAAERDGTAFAAAQGATTAAALRALPAETLLAAQSRQPGVAFRPVIDGYFLTEAPATSFADGRAAHVPLLVGTNTQEGPASAVLGDLPPTVANYRAGLARMFGARADAAFALYPAASDADVIAAATAVASDGFLAAQTWRWFDLSRRAGAPTYWYLFAHVRPRMVSDTSGRPLPWGAVHSAEIEYALGNLDANPLYVWTDADRQVSRTMSGYWANFVKTGDPNGAGLPRWPRAAADPAAIRRQVIDVDTRSAPFPEQARYEAAATLFTAR